MALHAAALRLHSVNLCVQGEVLIYDVLAAQVTQLLNQLVLLDGEAVADLLDLLLCPGLHEPLLLVADYILVKLDSLVQPFLNVLLELLREFVPLEGSLFVQDFLTGLDSALQLSLDDLDALLLADDCRFNDVLLLHFTLSVDFHEVLTLLFLFFPFTLSALLHRLYSGFSLDSEPYIVLLLNPL